MAFRKERILEALRHTPGQTVEQLIGLFRLKRTGIQETLTAMLKAGQVVRKYKARPASAAKKGRGSWVYYSKERHE